MENNTIEDQLEQILRKPIQGSFYWVKLQCNGGLPSDPLSIAEHVARGVCRMFYRRDNDEDAALICSFILSRDKERRILFSEIAGGLIWDELDAWYKKLLKPVEMDDCIEITYKVVNNYWEWADMW